MEDVVLVCGKWSFEKNKWSFAVDENKGCRILRLHEKRSFDEFLQEVYEDFSLDCQFHEVVLSYMFSKKMMPRLPTDTPPVVVSNTRQLIAYFRHTKLDRARLCVEVKARSQTDNFCYGAQGVGEREITVTGGRMEYMCGAGEEFIKQPKVEKGVKEEPGEKDPVGEVGKDESEQCCVDCCEDPDETTPDDEDYSVYGKLVDEAGEEEHMILPIKKRGAPVSADEEVVNIELASIDLMVGQTFESKCALETRLKMLSVLNKFEFNVDKSESGVFHCNCLASGCTWRLGAARKGTSAVFYIREYVPDHSCSATDRVSRCRQATPDILGKIYIDFVGGVGPGTVPEGVSDALYERYGLKIHFREAKQTLKIARKLVTGNDDDGYQDLPSYLYMIRRANPGTHTRLVVDSQDRFKYMFIAFGASLQGLPYMRKVVAVDRTSLQGNHNGTLIIATTQDGNFQTYPIAFGIVHTENDASWEWFFDQLSVVLPDDKELAIIADRHISIGNAIGKVYPRAARGICAYHILRNVMFRFRGRDEVLGLVKKASRAYSLQQFDDYFEQIRRLDPELHDYLKKADIRKWSRVHFGGERYNFTRNIIDKSMKKVLTGSRSFPVDKLLDAVRFMLSRWFAFRRKDARSMNTVLTRGVEGLLKTRIEQARQWTVEKIDEHQSKVICSATHHVVNLTARTCTCRVFDRERIPCEHAIAAAETSSTPSSLLCGPYYQTAWLEYAYSGSILPRVVAVPVPESIAAQICLPPMFRQPHGRPKQSRMRSGLELSQEIKRPRKQHGCSNCGEKGHNRTTCKV